MRPRVGICLLEPPAGSFDGAGLPQLPVEFVAARNQIQNSVDNRRGRPGHRRVRDDVPAQHGAEQGVPGHPSSPFVHPVQHTRPCATGDPADRMCDLVSEVTLSRGIRRRRRHATADRQNRNAGRPDPGRCRIAGRFGKGRRIGSQQGRHRPVPRHGLQLQQVRRSDSRGRASRRGRWSLCRYSRRVAEHRVGCTHLIPLSAHLSSPRNIVRGQDRFCG